MSCRAALAAFLVFFLAAAGAQPASSPGAHTLSLIDDSGRVLDRILFSVR